MLCTCLVLKSVAADRATPSRLCEQQRCGGFLHAEPSAPSVSLSPGGNREARACSRAEDFSGEQDHFDYTSEKLRNCVVNKRFEKDSGKT